MHNLKYQKILILTDNLYLMTQFFEVVKQLSIPENIFQVGCSNIHVKEALETSNKVHSIIVYRVKKDWQNIVNAFDLVLSIHCKQLFPTEMVKTVKCINIHPGFNPYNRGWYPQVFSILNHQPIGATLHEIDEQMDHGNIIDQKQVYINSYDTSLTIYNRVLNAEIELLKANLVSILKNDYQTHIPCKEGNVNQLQDFRDLCQLDLSKQQTVGETIDLLRALTHGDFHNAYFTDQKTGKKIYVSIQLKPENE